MPSVPRDAINSILTRIAEPDGNTDKALGDSLSDLISGMENAEIGGIFLQEGEGLALRALFGSIEDLMNFAKDLESGILLDSPKIYKQKDEADYLWVSAPIKCNEKVRGAIIIASLGTDGNKAQSFLEKAALHIGHLIEICGLQTNAQSAKDELPQQVQTGNMQE